MRITISEDSLNRLELKIIEATANLMTDPFAKPLLVLVYDYGSRYLNYFDRKSRYRKGDKQPLKNNASINDYFELIKERVLETNSKKSRYEIIDLYISKITFWLKEDLENQIISDKTKILDKLNELNKEIMYQ